MTFPPNNIENLLRYYYGESIVAAILNTPRYIVNTLKCHNEHGRIGLIAAENQLGPITFDFSGVHANRLNTKGSIHYENGILHNLTGPAFEEYKQTTASRVLHSELVQACWYVNGIWLPKFHPYASQEEFGKYITSNPQLSFQILEIAGAMSWIDEDHALAAKLLSPD